MLNVVPKPALWLTWRSTDPVTPGQTPVFQVAMYQPPWFLTSPNNVVRRLEPLPAAKAGRMLDLREFVKGELNPIEYLATPLFDGVMRPPKSQICLASDLSWLVRSKMTFASRLYCLLSRLDSLLEAGVGVPLCLLVAAQLKKRILRLKGKTAHLLRFVSAWKSCFAERPMRSATLKENSYYVFVHSSFDVLLTENQEHILSPLFCKAIQFYAQVLMPELEGVEPLPFEVWSSRYPLVRQRQLLAARQIVELMGLDERKAVVKNFLKIETSTNNTDPRNISPRSDEFLCVVGPYISALEHRFGNLPFLVKGLSISARDVKMTSGRGLQHYSHYIETDYSRFDMSISLEYLQDVENVFLTGCFDDRMYDYCFEMAMRTRGVSDIGLAYEVLGTRCSGDAHTSIGNGLINYFNTWLAFENLPGSSWASYHEGDDGIIGVDGAFVEAAKYNLHIFPVLGFQLKALLFTSFNLTTFCGRWLMADSQGIESICDLPRTLSKLHTICSDGDPQSLLLAKCMSYYHTDCATPILGVLVTAIIRNLKPVVSHRRVMRALVHLRRDYWFAQRVDNMKILDFYPYVESSAVSRAVVADRCRYSVGMQVAWERYYRQFEWCLPEVIDRLPGSWHFRPDVQYYSPAHDLVL